MYDVMDTSSNVASYTTGYEQYFITINERTGVGY